MGTSPESFSVVGMLRGICKQLATFLDNSIDDIAEDLNSLSNKFRKLITLIGEKAMTIIYIDGINVLYNTNQNSYTMEWLPTVLPQNIKIIISVMSEVTDTVVLLEKVVESKDNFINIEKLNITTSSEILNAWLTERQRTLTCAQWELVNKAMLDCNLPLQLRLIFNEVINWHSYDIAKLLTVTVHKGIMRLLEQVEERHGKVLTSRALGYVTASRNGVSESELDDLLSLDNNVLSDVYQYFVPPITRIPPLLWTRLRNDLHEYLIERQADDVTVVVWYHRQFVDVACERYFRNVNFEADIHSHLTEYFQGTWAGGKLKPFEITDEKRQRFGLDSTKGQSDRKIPLQPLVFKSSEGKIVGYNKRKLNELPFHFLRCHKYDELFSNVLFNFEWLHAKLSCMPLYTLIEDFEDAISHVFDQEVILLRDTFKLSASILRCYPHMLGPEIVGRLLPYFDHYKKINRLIKQCDEKGTYVNALVPIHHFLQAPGGPLQYSLEGHTLAPYGTALSTDGKYLVSADRKLYVWDLQTGDIRREVHLDINGIVKYLRLTNDNITALGYTSKNQIITCNILNGERSLWQNFPELSSDIVGLYEKDDILLIWTARTYILCNIDKTLLSQFNLHIQNESIVNVLPLYEDVYCIVSISNAPDADMTTDKFSISFSNDDSNRLTFTNAYVFSCHGFYVGNASNNAIIDYYKYSKSGWQLIETICNISEPIHVLHISHDEKYLAVTVTTGYYLFNLPSRKMIRMQLPKSTINFFTRPRFQNLVAFSRRCEFLITAVKTSFFVFDVTIGNIVKVFEAHFARILCLLAVHVNMSNKIISTSSDTTIKVWDMDKIYNDAHQIDKHDKAIEQLLITDENTSIVFAVTHGHIGIWNTQTGRLLKTLKFDSRQSVPLVKITKDTRFIIICEVNKVSIWHVNTTKLMRSIMIANVKHVLITTSDSMIIIYQKAATDSKDRNNWKISCQTIQDGTELYLVDVIADEVIHSSLSSDNSLLVIGFLNKTKYTLSYYHAETGTKLDEFLPKYPNSKPIIKLVIIPNFQLTIALIDVDKGNIIDLTKKVFVRSILNWNGTCSIDGKIGLSAPEVGGGLNLLDLHTGRILNTLLPRANLGAFNVITFFTNQGYIIYYNSSLQIIFVFRRLDYTKIAEFKCHYTVRALGILETSNTLVVGSVDGGVTALTLIDHNDQVRSKEIMLQLQHRTTIHNQLQRRTSQTINFTKIFSRYKTKHTHSRTCSLS